jgi:hypothetical protein
MDVDEFLELLKLWVSPDDPALPGRIRRLWAVSARLVEPYAPRGVRRFRTIEEANADRGRWARERVRQLIAERAAATGDQPPRG